MEQSADARRGTDLAIALLVFLAAQHGAVRVQRVLDHLDAPRATVARLIAAFEKAGLLVRPHRGMIALGPAAAALVLAREDVLRRDDEKRLARRTREQARAPGASYALLRHEESTAVMAGPRRATRPRMRLGLANAALNGPWRVALVHSVEYGAVKYADSVHSLLVRHAEDEASRQAEDILALVESGADGLIVSAASGPEVLEAVAEAARRGVPSVFVDRRPSGDLSAAPFITCDDAVIGRVTGLWVAEYLEGRGRVMLLPGLASAEPAQIRLGGARAALSAFPGIEILGVHWTGWQPRIGREVMRATLAQHGGAISAVWCDSGLQAVGSLKAFIARGGPIPPHTGGDLNLAYKLALRHHVPLAAMDYPPAMGLKSVEVLLDMLRGRAVPRRIDVATEIVLTRGAATASVEPDLWADEHVRWDLPDNLILASGLGPSYDPRSFRIHYRGNRYNRSAADRLAGGPA